MTEIKGHTMDRFQSEQGSAVTKQSPVVTGQSPVVTKQDVSASEHSRAKPSGFFAVIGGAMASMVSALVTVFLLSINGAIALVVFSVFAEGENEWLKRKDVLQFGLFTLPLILLVVEWIVWDQLQAMFGRRRSEQDRWNST